MVNEIDVEKGREEEREREKERSILKEGCKCYFLTFFFLAFFKYIFFISLFMTPWDTLKQIVSTASVYFEVLEVQCRFDGDLLKLLSRVYCKQSL